eukprot:CAMPEP_0114335168 /NCGR_PEP_ID=MMETSP0101-20121206/4878_1 /TAXON_ID=38822 ORGANISM="Pteridomonas danica, Strain PT" /NCGR_SAMPLE_ID=MMETSP0101 /ASSEMBLY_ACC=CAM_ASM_000211 /LENGTH=86 /DNA_ID=CAMNT_0001466703 /DNA_START=77 /DNA_END=334 /DNA_ORIENTATION=+
MSVTSKFELSLPVVDHGMVRYHFTTTGGDICFKADFVSKSDADFNIATILRDRQRDQSHSEPIKGELNVPGAGTLVLTWDNYGAPW